MLACEPEFGSDSELSVPKITFVCVYACGRDRFADASGTLLLDVANRRWSGAMLDALEIDKSCLPALFESSEITGRISADGAAATGLREGLPVVAGAGDQAAGAVGMGIVRPGAVSATIGTSGVVFAATDRPALDKGGRVHTFCHAIAGRWHVMGVTQAAGLSLRWFRDRFGLGDGPASSDGADPYDILCKEAAGAPPGSDGVLWAPYLMGERTPHLYRSAGSVSAWRRSTPRTPSGYFEGWRSRCATRFESSRDGSAAFTTPRGGGARGDGGRYSRHLRCEFEIYSGRGGVYGRARRSRRRYGCSVGRRRVRRARCRALETGSPHQRQERRLSHYRALLPALRSVAEAAGYLVEGTVITRKAQEDGLPEFSEFC